MKKTLLVMALCLITLMSYSQRIAVLNFMKVPASGGDAYVANEKEWKKIHQTRVNEGKMVAWELFYIHNSGTESPYNWVTVDVYENMEAALNEVTLDEIKKAWGEKYNDVLKKTTSVRNLAYSETFEWTMGIQDKEKYKYLLVSAMKADDLGKYFEMEKKAYMPMHQAAIDGGKMNGWSVWSRWFHNDTSYNAITVNSFTTAAQLSSMNYDSLFEKAKAGKSTDELFEMVKLMDETESIRTIVRAQLWELVDITTPKK
jgi:hypothetical protein